MTDKNKKEAEQWTHANMAKELSKILKYKRQKAKGLIS
jgi:hypothetical protein